MRRVFQLASSFALVVMLAAPAWAQQSATIVLRSGERLSGQLVDMGGSGFTVNVSGSERQIPTGDVAVIDFSGSGDFPSSEVNQISGNNLIVLSDGQTVSGTLYDIGGTQPLRITVDTANGRRDYSSNEIRRIYLARPSASGSSSSSSSTTQSTTGTTMLPATGGQIRVPGNQRWVDTGITVRKGQRVAFSASGQVQLSSDTNDTAGPAGSNNGRRANGSAMPSALAGALIGRVGMASVFGIGNQTTALTMPADGRLYLGINDDEVSDNQGEFTVDVRPEPMATRR